MYYILINNFQENLNEPSTSAVESRAEGSALNEENAQRLGLSYPIMEGIRREARLQLAEYLQDTTMPDKEIIYPMGNNVDNPGSTIYTYEMIRSLKV